MSKAPPIVDLADGSFTCLDAATGELYHNKAGAIAEALTNFVQPLALTKMCEEAQKRDGAVSVLDLPFGLGYNSFVLLNELLALNAPLTQGIEIVAVEQDASIFSLIDRVLDDSRLHRLKDALSTNRPVLIQALKNQLPISLVLHTGSQFTDLRLQLFKDDMRKVVPQLADAGRKFDAIMHDPFSANKMPELWTVDLFKLYRRLLHPAGRISTYSVAAAVRAGLKLAGHHVYGTAAVGEKSGGTVAAIEPIELSDAKGDGIFALSADDAARLTGRSGVPYRDPDLSLTAAAIRKARLQEQDALKNTLGKG